MQKRKTINKKLLTVAANVLDTLGIKLIEFKINEFACDECRAVFYCNVGKEEVFAYCPECGCKARYCGEITLMYETREKKTG